MTDKIKKVIGKLLVANAQAYDNGDIGPYMYDRIKISLKKLGVELLKFEKKNAVKV